MYVQTSIKGGIIQNSKLNQNSVSFMHMSKLCCKFQTPAPNTIGGIAETQIVQPSVTYIWTYVRTRVKLYAPPHFVAGHENKTFKQLT